MASIKGAMAISFSELTSFRWVQDFFLRLQPDGMALEAYNSQLQVDESQTRQRHGGLSGLALPKLC